jgi:type IV secretory pathway VirB2 component (pilin)
MHNLLTGSFGKGTVALVIISMGLAGIFGKLSYRSLITFFVGVVCIFGSYQVVYLLTGYNYQMCELVDTSTPPGKCGDNYEEETLANSVS